MIVQDDPYNRSALHTVIVAAVTSNIRLGGAPGNVTLSARETGLSRDSVVNVTQLLTVNKDDLVERIGSLAPGKVNALNDGLKRVLGLREGV